MIHREMAGLDANARVIDMNRGLSPSSSSSMQQTRALTNHLIIHLPDICTSSLLNTSHNAKNLSTCKLAVRSPSIPEVLGNSRVVVVAVVVVVEVVVVTAMITVVVESSRAKQSKYWDMMLRFVLDRGACSAGAPSRHCCLSSCTRREGLFERGRGAYPHYVSLSLSLVDRFLGRSLSSGLLLLPENQLKGASR